jgi:hypothetical protein
VILGSMIAPSASAHLQPKYSGIGGGSDFYFGSAYLRGRTGYSGVYCLCSRSRIEWICSVRG